MIMLAQIPDVQEIAARFFSNLLSGNFSKILEAFEGEPLIDAPRTGLVTGHDAVTAFLEDEKSWLESIGAAPDKLTLVKNTSSPERVVHEVCFQLPIPPKTRQIVLASLADIGIEGITVIRLFYSYGFLASNQDFVRKTMQPMDSGLIDQIPGPVRTCVEMIAAADFDATSLLPQTVT